MRVLHLENGRSLYGGARQLIYLIEELRSLGIDNALLAPRDAAIIGALRGGAAQIYTHHCGGDLDFRLVGVCMRTLRDFRADLLHVHSRRGADLWGGLAARRCHLPALLSRRVDHPDSRLALRYKYPLYRRVIAISEGIARVLQEQGLPAAQLRTVRSAIRAELAQSPVDRDEFCARFGLAPDVKAIAIIAQLIPRKGHRVLFAALPELLHKYPQLQLLCFGAGSERAALAAEIDRLGLAERVQLPGFLPDLRRFLMHFCMVVHPALREGLGVALLEAAAAGVPIVGSHTGGIPEIVRDGENGILTAPGDVQALRTAMDTLLGDTERAEQMGRAGRAIVDREFSVRTMAEGNLAVYQEILAPVTE